MQSEDAIDVVKGFKMPGMYDYHKVQPATYNLSIQYDKEMKADAKKEAQKAKKKKMMEDVALNNDRLDEED